MSHTVIGVFKTTNEAQIAISDLVENSFRHEDIELSVHGESLANKARVTVQTASLKDAELAQEILDDAGSLSIDDNAATIDTVQTTPAEGGVQTFLPFREGYVVFVERSEKATITKEPRIIEEILLETKVVERDKTVHTTTRHSEVTVERFDKDEKPFNL